MGDYYEPEGLRDLVRRIVYKPGWQIFMSHKVEADGSGGLMLVIISLTMDSLRPEQDIMVRHNFLIPPASYNQQNWLVWIRNRINDVETHELNEFFKVDDVRVFAPHHSDGEDPYVTWYIGDWETAAKNSGDE